MKMATISQTKNNLSALLDRVRHGETILIMDRNRPVARLEPVPAAGRTADEHRIDRLERAGLARRGAGQVPKAILNGRPPRVGHRGDVLAALLAEREEGR